jgi:hypothetical protein
MDIKNKQIEELRKDKYKLLEQVEGMKKDLGGIIADLTKSHVDDVIELGETHEAYVTETESELKDKRKDIVKLIETNKILKQTIKTYKEDNEEYNQSVGIINMVSADYDRLKLNRNRIVSKYQKKIYIEGIRVKREIKAANDKIIRIQKETKKANDKITKHNKSCEGQAVDNIKLDAMIQIVKYTNNQEDKLEYETLLNFFNMMVQLESA